MYDIRSTVYNSINSNFIPNIYRRLVMKSIQQEYLYLLLPFCFYWLEKN